jgi:hypothetical protein
MGRSRKTSAQHEQSGSFDKHPERKAARALEPKPKEPLGGPPLCFTAAGGASDYTGSRLITIWNEIVAEAPPGVLTNADRKHVELACRLLFRIRKDQAKSGDYSRLDVLLGKMGMNPADRSKVNVAAGSILPNDDTERSPFEDLAAETVSARPN